MKLYCDDGSTNVKLAWFDEKKLQTKLSTNSFRNGWKIEGLGGKGTYNYELEGQKFTYDEVSEQAIRTTHIEYQYTDANVLAIHHALLNSDISPQPVVMVNKFCRRSKRHFLVHDIFDVALNNQSLNGVDNNCKTECNFQLHR